MSFDLTEFQKIARSSEPFRLPILQGDASVYLVHNVVDGVETITPDVTLPKDLNCSVEVREGDGDECEPVRASSVRDAVITATLNLAATFQQLADELEDVARLMDPQCE